MFNLLPPAGEKTKADQEEDDELLKSIDDHMRGSMDVYHLPGALPHKEEPAEVTFVTSSSTGASSSSSAADGASETIGHGAVECGCGGRGGIRADDAASSSTQRSQEAQQATQVLRCSSL